MSTDVVKTYVKWKQVEDFPEYFVSNTGIVRLRNRIIPPLYAPTNGRPYFSLRKLNPNKYARFYLYTLVWDVWGNSKRKIGNREYNIHHKDHNFLNNHIDNLELLTWVEHLAKHGKKPKMK